MAAGAMNSQAVNAVLRLPLLGGLFTFDAFGILLGWFVALEMKDEVS